MPGDIAVIFDMDGVITDNNAYHEIAWKEFCQQHNIFLSNDEIHHHVFGRIAKDTLEYIFKREISQAETDKFVDEKETIYRQIYKDHIRPIDGLLELLDELKGNGIPLALATSAPSGNVDFTFSFIQIRDYFDHILDASHINKGKPDPEIYAKAILKLSNVPERCLVFEDSKAGIQSARSAGAKVVGLATTHSPEELTGVVKVIKNFREISIQEIITLINK